MHKESGPGWAVVKLCGLGKSRFHFELVSSPDVNNNGLVLTSLASLSWSHLCENALKSRAFFIMLYTTCRLSTGLFGREVLAYYFFAIESKRRRLGATGEPRELHGKAEL